MPNHVANVIKMKGISELPLFSIDDNGEKYFDFNKIIPMPKSLDIVSGSVTEESIVYYLTEKCTIPIKSLDEEKRSLVKKVINNIFGGEDWPEEVFRRLTEKSHTETEKQKMYEDGEIYVSNYQKYGCTTWYDWCRMNWGTKWNAYSFELWDEDTIKFETAWSNPEPVINRLSEMYRGMEIEHWWADENCGYNTGYRNYVDGCVYGGYDINESSDAYEHYEFCWGGSECIYQDEEGNYKKHDCESCRACY